MGGAGWTEADVGDLSGRTFLVTGGNSGIGAEAVRIFAEHGGHVLLACRDMAKGAPVAEALSGAPGTVEVMTLDLADLATVEATAGEVRRRVDHLDVLCNNAGVMATPYRRTVDGFELQLGTNHLGHFALTAHLLPLLLRAPAPRVVTVASSAHRMGAIDFDDLHSERRYGPWTAYGQSKLANLLFTAELQRRSDAAGARLLAAAAHPGYAATNLQTAGPLMDGSAVKGFAMKAMNAVFGQSARMGALPTVYAAVAAAVEGGDYIGPSGIAEARGHPEKVARSKVAQDTAVARRLWEVSAELTGAEPDLGAASG
jgi:NAD(P)-dependent dehydrogenase (short-subunit alcohol dehydrogenase family)